MNPEPEYLRLVFDTNVLVSSLSSRSATHWLVQGLREARYEMLVTTEILLEYEEVLRRKYDALTAEYFMAGLSELPNVVLATAHYRWQLLADPDDDKFVDAALAGSAHYLVTEDAHFRPLSKVDFPRVRVIGMEQLRELLGPNATA